MKELLPLLPRPARYLGSEWGTMLKDKTDITIHMAQAFPDMYEIGMSYMGQKILMKAINDHAQYWCERVYTPCEETAAIMQERDVPLATLESDTPLAELDAIGFSLTHELCYTNILYMLDLARIPRRTENRNESHPLLIAGGGACFNAEPMAPFFDIMVVGDGEEAMPAILNMLEAAKRQRTPRPDLLRQLRIIPGVYVPSLFETQGPGKPLKPTLQDYTHVEKAVVEDLDAIEFPQDQPVSYGQAIHDRLTMEIARGCTRGCRFCQAGMIYRPVRERTPEKLTEIMINGLAATGYEETSFLSLSTGDYSALDTLFSDSFDRCSAEQVAISLPSLRVGSLSEPIMERISSIRRTGATLAPEAGSQRMRDVINKGITEQELMDHVRLLFDNGWQSVKLYFMIGLPTETDKDLDAILDLCLKVRDVAGPHIKRLQVGAAISPFVPKPHTPFQWEAQISLEEIQRRIDYLRNIFRPHKRVRLKFHIPEMTFLEGIFSRGDRRLADVVEAARDNGALFSSWKDKLNLAPYLEAMRKQGLIPEEYTGARDVDAPLPWDHLNSGVTKRFMLAERKRALSETITKDCRYNACRQCGICNHKGTPSRLEKQGSSKQIKPHMVFTTRDQEGEQPPYIVEKPNLNAKGGHYRIWYEKKGLAAYLSQLELQSMFERAMRRAKLPVSFSAGFHPLPRMSFGKALPVGVESTEEWLNLFLRENWTPERLVETLDAQMPRGIHIYKADTLSMGKKQPQSVEEHFQIRFTGVQDETKRLLNQWNEFMNADTLMIEKKTKKGKIKEVNVRTFVTDCKQKDDSTLGIVLNWREGYMSPLKLVQTVNSDLDPVYVSITKTKQIFD